MRRFVLAFVFLWFLLGGLAHFAFTGAEMSIVPPYLPDHRLLVQVSGAFELMGAAGLILRKSRRMAGWGLFALTLAVTPANIYMWQTAARFPQVPEWALALRLPFQLVLLVAIWWSSQQDRPE